MSNALPDIPGGWTERDVAVAGRTFCMALPADPDAFLDDPRVHEAHAKTGYMPYWGYLWPAALATAEKIVTTDWPSGLAALEIGAGTGLVGLAALSRGLAVTFSDHDPQAVEVCLHNAALNGFAGAKGLVLDWRHPLPLKFNWIFGCDVIYEAPNHAPILDLLQRMLADGGEAWLSDPGRHQTEAFVALAGNRGFRVSGDLIPGTTTTVWRLVRS